MDELNKRLEKQIEKYRNENNSEKLQRLYLIEKILQDENCFFKMPIEVAYSILSDLEYENKDEKYKELMSFSNYKNFKFTNNI